MIEWKNFDSLESYRELAKAERVKLAEVMSGESGAERVKAWQQAWSITMRQSRWMKMCLQY